MASPPRLLRCWWRPTLLSPTVPPAACAAWLQERQSEQSVAGRTAGGRDRPDGMRGPGLCAEVLRIRSTLIKPRRLSVPRRPPAAATDDAATDDPIASGSCVSTLRKQPGGWPG